MASTIGQPLTLNCGLQLKNRLVKAAMAECMADNNSLPTSLHNNLYRTWGDSEWGMILTGMSPAGDDSIVSRQADHGPFKN